MIRSVLSAIALIAATIVVSGCQSPPQPLIIGAVQVIDPLNQPVAQISVTDQRPHAYLYRITHGEDKAEFAPPQQPLTEVISNSLTNLTSSQAGDLVGKSTLTKPSSVVNWVLLIMNCNIPCTAGQQRKPHLQQQLSWSLAVKGVGRPDEAVVERFHNCAFRARGHQ